MPKHLKLGARIARVWLQEHLNQALCYPQSDPGSVPCTHRGAHLKAALLGLALVLLLALLGHSPGQLVQQGLCYHVHPPCPRVLGLHIHKVWVHTQRQIAWQRPAHTARIV